MGRPRLPTSVLELRGAFKKDPGRRRSTEPVPEGTLCDPPACLTPAQRSVYLEIARKAPEGLFCRADSIAVECLARLIAEFRADPGAFSRGKQARLFSMLSRCGLTPADRQRLGL